MADRFRKRQQDKVRWERWIAVPGNLERYRERKRKNAKAWREKNAEHFLASRRQREEKKRIKIVAAQILCACGCGEFITSINPGAKYVFGHVHRGRERTGFTPAAIRTTVAEVYWVAGFLEGEGSFQLAPGNGPSQRIQATQVQREPLERLQKYLGGKIIPKSGSGVSGYNRNSQPAFIWYLSGSRARGVMMTVYSLMSPKRQEQIKKALGDGKWV